MFYTISYQIFIKEVRSKNNLLKIFEFFILWHGFPLYFYLKLHLESLELTIPADIKFLKTSFAVKNDI